ncbi:MAG: cyanophycinase [Flavobacteriales bacterium]|nr:cyanophycinase [Flavobacteriales bacterium]
MARTVFSLLVALLGLALSAQTYTSWFTGNTTDLAVEPLGGTCMMGGASEFDPAMQWFLDRANGGDVLVLRASGSDGYNDYMYSDLGGVNSVETILFNGAAAASDPYVLERISKAEAIWFAGGDQWNYVNYWRNSPIMTAINDAISQRHIAIGGTSAGMAILGGCYFSAQNGSVTSAEALSNPFNTYMTVDCAPFLQVPFMANTITDTHYDNPDRRGRHFTFLARMAQQGDSAAYGIACNEYVAVCVAPDGIAHVYGEYPQYQEFAYFLRMNCTSSSTPEVCEAGMPLTWDRNGMAVKTYKVPGLSDGANWFDLNDHYSGQGGAWEDWSAVAGSFITQPGDAPPCGATGIQFRERAVPVMEWDAVSGRAKVVGLVPGSTLMLYAVDGRNVQQATTDGSGRCSMAIPADASGILLLRGEGQEGQRVWKIVH